MEELKKASRRYWFAAAAGALIGVANLSAVKAQDTESSGPRWVATWSVSPMAPGTAAGDGGSSRSFDNQTLRQVVHISVGGTRVRVKLSNEYGQGPLIIGSANIAVQSTGASIVSKTRRQLTFNGYPSVTIPQGGVVLSDDVGLSVASNTNLAISLYFPQNTGPATFHNNGTQIAYISGPGDFSDAINFPVQEQTPFPHSRYFLAFVEVLPVKRVGALALIGDSISEGAHTTVDANKRVTDVLSREFNPPGAPPRLAFLNQATGCGRLLRDFCGPSGLSRFGRDVLNAAGIKKVVIELGYGDIIFPPDAGIASAEEIIAGLRQLISQARARGLTVYGATMSPNEGTTFEGVHTPENEAKREAVNHWIRTSGEFDGVADYDLAVRDPSHPARLLPIYAHTDNIHLNDAGHEAIARTIAALLH